MGDMQKVRVSLTDAEGKVHEVVGYQSYGNTEYATILPHPSDGNAVTGETKWYIVCHPSICSSIQELPTGLGAVVEVDYGPPINEVERFVHIGDDYWHEARSCRELTSSEMSRMTFTILSEGVK